MQKFKTNKTSRVASLSMAILLTAVTFLGCSKPNTQDITDASTEKGTATFTPGTYEGSAKGFGGDVTAKVTLTTTAIENIEVVGDQETDGIGSTAIKQIPDEMLKSQTSSVDVVAGATVTSDAIIEAVNAALIVAGVDPKSLTGTNTITGEKKQEVIETDVVVIGGGGAGMTSAITIKQAGLDVVIMEKMAMVGGNTVKATGGMNAAETKYQAADSIEDSIQTFIDDTMKGGQNINNIDLVTIMAEKSSEGIDWLETINAPLPKVSFSGGATNARIHAPEDGSGVGSFLVDVFSKQVEELEIPVYLNSEVTEIIMKDGKAVGVKSVGKEVDYTINAKVVILATGGFGANEEMYTKYRPELKGFVTTNTPGATGDGILMAEAIDAGLVDIDQIQIHPTVEQTTSIMVTEGVRGDGAILVNNEGKRFTNELLTRDVVSANIIAQEEGFSYIIFDQKLRDNLKAIEKYVSANIVIEGGTIEELATKIDVDPSVLAETLATWNASVAAQTDVEFERTTGMENDLTTAPYYAIKIAPGVHHTMGGVEINTKAEVLSKTGEVISGLLAAGEVTGGIHGANRIGGNAVADIVVFGRIAGETAIEAVKAE